MSSFPRKSGVFSGWLSISHKDSQEAESQRCGHHLLVRSTVYRASPRSTVPYSLPRLHGTEDNAALTGLNMLEYGLSNIRHSSGTRRIFSLEDHDGVWNLRTSIAYDDGSDRVRQHSSSLRVD